MRELAPACLRIGLKLEEDGEDPELIICFAKIALRGERAFDEGLLYLERAERILGRLEKEGCSDEDFRPLLYAVQFELANLKIGLGWSQEALEIHQKQLGQNSAEVASDRRLLGVIYTVHWVRKAEEWKVLGLIADWSSQELILRLCRWRWGSRKPPLIL
ncbi:hypothetical protein FH972_027124 [Carpinus fangiana]|uniref:MalT-like TPR region domain-containing protein n=1 Tax=Carpinus fangiana TaxID=176857 RepID=A0A5N6L645_9ROSI|nr:hypothetical protein FH972_027124 [Carpinus fangiana]